MGKRIEAIKRMMQATPQEVMAGYLFHFVVNSKDQFWKTKYYDQTAYFELNTDNDAFMIDVLYMGQETSFPLNAFMHPTPDYNSVLAITDNLLSWLENTYAAHSAALPEPPRPRRRRVKVAKQQQLPQPAMNTRMPNGNNARRQKSS
ncbi:MAG: hypothetical protein IJ202_02430 [Bacteroidales bacterium]|nr:hypothetical protein [Bacteroidales bacterium]